MADEPRIVAELGRPATPEDIRDRREASRSFRFANNTTTNLLIAIGATLLVMVTASGRSFPGADRRCLVDSVRAGAPTEVVTSREVSAG